MVDSSSGSTYSLWGAILDADEPWKVIARCKAPLLFPQTDYERSGRVQNVVFTCNALLDNGVVRMYYSAADSVIGIAEMPLDDIVKCCFEDYEFMMHPENC